jgi:prolactin regulatory element-binding protein
MQTNQIVKKAHLGLVTALTFSPDSRFFLYSFTDSMMPNKQTDTNLKEEKMKPFKSVTLGLVLQVLSVSIF